MPKAPKEIKYRNISKAAKDYYANNPESRKKRSLAFTGEKNPMFGKNLSDEARKKMSESVKGRKLSTATRKKMSEIKKMQYSNQENRKKHSARMKDYYAKQLKPIRKKKSKMLEQNNISTAVNTTDSETHIINSSNNQPYKIFNVFKVDKQGADYFNCALNDDHNLDDIFDLERDFCNNPSILDFIYGNNQCANFSQNLLQNSVQFINEESSQQHSVYTVDDYLKKPDDKQLQR